MNQAFRDLHLNKITPMIPLSSLDDTGVTGSALDLLNTQNPNHVVLATMSDLTDIARVFVTIQESFEGGSVWNPIAAFPALIALGMYSMPIKRTKRFLRVVVTTEPPDTPVAPAFILAVALLT